MRPSRALVVAVSLCVGLVVTACGGNDPDSEADIVDELTSSIQEADGWDEESARCYAEIVVDEVGLEALQDIDISDDEPPADMQEPLARAAQRAGNECAPAGGG